MKIKAFKTLILASSVIISVSSNAMTCTNRTNSIQPMKFVVTNQTSSTFNYTGTYITKGNLSGGNTIQPGAEITFKMNGEGLVTFFDDKYQSHTYFNYDYSNLNYAVNASNVSNKYAFRGLCMPDGNEIIITEK